jgi:hypothetical protein
MTTNWSTIPLLNKKTSCFTQKQEKTSQGPDTGHKTADDKYDINKQTAKCWLPSQTKQTENTAIFLLNSSFSNHQMRIYNNTLPATDVPYTASNEPSTERVFHFLSSSGQLSRRINVISILKFF